MAEKLILLAGNPNVGKSTIFNNLTGKHQHTGNWTGKTVGSAKGTFRYDDEKYQIIDIPGTYSLYTHSQEEEVARDYICFEKSDLIVVVCDATSLRRNLNFVLQIIETGRKVLVCVNLLDEAKRKHISIDLDLLAELLGVPVVGLSASHKKEIIKLKEAIVAALNRDYQAKALGYGDDVETKLLSLIENIKTEEVDKRWLALRIYENEPSFIEAIREHLGNCFQEGLCEKHGDLNFALKLNQYSREIASKVIKHEEYHEDVSEVDRLLTNKWIAYPLMLVLVGLLFWLSIVGASYPSLWLQNFFNWFKNILINFLINLGLRGFWFNFLIQGIYEVVTWVVAVMFPPMAIFFPLFSLLEDCGFLPRIAFNLDSQFKKCNACGKQALTMCMGIGCNVVGVTGTRIIDSPRERLIALLTNSFMPCNGRLPAMISIISLFIISGSGILSSFYASIILVIFLLFSILLTLFISWLLSRTLLKGIPSSFVLELPPYRKPDFLQVIYRSFIDKTLRVLYRAILVSIPAGILIFLLNNVNYYGISLLTRLTTFLNPLGLLLGMDGIILTAFILGFPANEIVMPLMLMMYSNGSGLSELGSQAMQEILLANGWDIKMAICVLIFFLLHFPCATTMATIKKESGSWYWTMLSFVLPLSCGFSLCFLINLF